MSEHLSNTIVKKELNIIDVLPFGNSSTKIMDSIQFDENTLGFNNTTTNENFDPLKDLNVFIDSELSVLNIKWDDEKNYLQNNTTKSISLENQFTTSNGISSDIVSSSSNTTTYTEQQTDNNLKVSMDKYLAKDERLAKNANILISVTDIVNASRQEYNNLLFNNNFTKQQISVIRSIRRRGKNKICAQNCRKNKLDKIKSLSEQVKYLKMCKENA